MALSESLRLTWFRGLAQAVSRREISTSGILTSRTNSVVGASPDEFRLYVGNPTEAAAYYSQEADRFASASFESILTNARSEAYPRSTGWLVIRSYYAAFFAFHALVRIRGLACTRVTADMLTLVNREAKTIFALAEPYKAGIYELELEDDGRTVCCRRLNPTMGGSHEVLWSLLSPYLTWLLDTVLANPDADHQELAVLIDSLQLVLTKRGGAQWFTRLRNKVNYAHGMGTWFPYRGTTTDYDRLSDALQGWASEPAPLEADVDELIQFTRTCKFLVSTCATTVRDLHFRSQARAPVRSSSGLLLRGN